MAEKKKKKKKYLKGGRCWSEDLQCLVYAFDELDTVHRELNVRRERELIVDGGRLGRAFEEAADGERRHMKMA